MFIERVYDRGLAQASYVVACQASGEAVVIDPRRDVDVYLDIAAREEFSITRVVETHVHADYLSGARELAAATGAELLLSGEGGAEWQYRFDHTPLHDGDMVKLGNLSLQAVHTPGHTPEHLSFLLFDHATADRPRMIFTGDFLFAGDVGRPDLLDEAAGYSGTREVGARALYASLRRVAELPDDILVWPGHGAGSACGKALGAVPVSTLGFERDTNPAFGHDREDAFVSWLLEGQPEAPSYFGTMKRLNIARPRESVRAAQPGTDSLPVFTPEQLAGSDVQVFDLRDAGVFADAHLPGSINIPVAEDMATWFGWLADYDRDIVLVVGHEHRETALRALLRIGLDRCIGFIDPAALSERVTASAGTAASRSGTIESVDVQAARKLIAQGIPVLDVRSRSEYEEGHIDVAHHRHLGYLTDFRPEDPAQPILVHCQSGYRSSIAASVLVRNGVQRVFNLAGGYDAWSA